MATPLVRTRSTENPAGFAGALLLNVWGSWVNLLSAGPGLKDPSGQDNGYGGQLLSALFINNGASNRKVTLYLVPSGQAINSFFHPIFDDYVPANSIVTWQPTIPEKYKGGAVVYGVQDAGTDVYAKVQAVEFY